MQCADRLPLNTSQTHASLVHLPCLLDFEGYSYWQLHFLQGCFQEEEKPEVLLDQAHQNLDHLWDHGKATVAEAINE